jgi:hypothetical protein
MCHAYVMETVKNRMLSRREMFRGTAASAAAAALGGVAGGGLLGARPVAGATLVVGSPKHRGGTGGLRASLP